MCPLPPPPPPCWNVIWGLAMTLAMACRGSWAGCSCCDQSLCAAGPALELGGSGGCMAKWWGEGVMQ